MNNLTGIGYLKNPQEVQRKKALIARVKREAQEEEEAERKAYDAKEARWKEEMRGIS